MKLEERSCHVPPLLVPPHHPMSTDTGFEREVGNTFLGLSSKVTCGCSLQEVALLFLLVVGGAFSLCELLLPYLLVD